MELADIKPKHCYRLVDGRRVRVITVGAGTARCDVYDPQARKWVSMFNTLPVALISQPCACPEVDK
jgi:hypothetical protein